MGGLLRPIQLAVDVNIWANSFTPSLPSLERPGTVRLGSRAASTTSVRPRSSSARPSRSTVPWAQRGAAVAAELDAVDAEGESGAQSGAL